MKIIKKDLAYNKKKMFVGKKVNTKVTTLNT